MVFIFSPEWSVFSALILLAILWEGIWKLIAMWKAVKRDSVVWFIVLAIFNTLGILPILYIYVFSEMKRKKRRKTSKK